MSESTSLVVHGEVLPKQQSLAELVERANYEHGLVEEMLGQALDHVIKSGNALSEARNQIEFKGWEKWVEENFKGGRVVASYYMRIAEHSELVSGLPNVTQAMKRLRGMPALRPPGYRGYSEEIREEARALAGSGMSYMEIARILGPAPDTIRNWIDPAALRRHRERTREQSAKRREERRRKKKEAQQRAAEREARRVGGALAECYSLAHKLDGPLARAERNAIDPEVKALLAEAISFHHRMLYRVVDALGAS